MNGWVIAIEAVVFALIPSALAGLLISVIR